MAVQTPLTAYRAFESQLKTLCLSEFPCGIGTWKENFGQKRKVIEKDKVNSKFSITLKDFGASHEKTETLGELVTAKHSPWNIDYSWSDEARQLREIAVRSPWLVDKNFVLRHFRTLRIVDKGVAEVDEHFLQFGCLEELCLSANELQTVNSRNLPRSLRVLELCANHISNLADLCCKPPPLTHLGLGYNALTMVDDYVTGDYWPQLLSLDLSYNNLSDLMDIVKKLQTLPKLGNLVLQGNPLALMAAYRGYTIDSLRSLAFLDDISISADERHHYKGLAKRKEHILDEGKVSFHVAYIKGLPMPEEMKNPEEQPEFPIITRKYFVKFMYPEEKSAQAEIFQIMQDDQFSELQGQSQLMEQIDGLTTERESTGQPASLQPPPDIQVETPHGATPAPQTSKMAKMQMLQQEYDAASGLATASIPEPSEPEVEPGSRLSPIHSGATEWQEDIQLIWTSVVARDDLLALRNFYKVGMEVSVVEETVRSFPADQVEGGAPSPTPSQRSKTKVDKKAEKPKDQKSLTGKGDKKKKKGEPDIDLVHMPPEFRTLATFHMPLAGFLEGDFKQKKIFTFDWETGPRAKTPTESEVSSRRIKSPPTSPKRKSTPSPTKRRNTPSPMKKRTSVSPMRNTLVEHIEMNMMEPHLEEILQDGIPSIPRSGRMGSTISQKLNKKSKLAALSRTGKSVVAVESENGKKKKPGSAASRSGKDKKDKKKEVKVAKVAENGEEDGESAPPPPLEISVAVRLHHWKTAYDSMRPDKDEEVPEVEPQAE